MWGGWSPTLPGCPHLPLSRAQGWGISNLLGSVSLDGLTVASCFFFKIDLPSQLWVYTQVFSDILENLHICNKGGLRNLGEFETVPELYETVSCDFHFLNICILDCMLSCLLCPVSLCRRSLYQWLSVPVILWAVFVTVLWTGVFPWDPVWNAWT